MVILKKRERNSFWLDINRGEKMAKILIVVDMQNDFIDGALGTKEAVAIVPYVKEVIENDLIKELDVYKDGKIVYLIEHANVWYTSTGGVQALDTMLGDLEGALLNKE